MQAQPYSILPPESSPDPRGLRVDSDSALGGVPWYIAQNAYNSTLTIFEGELQLRANCARFSGGGPPRRRTGDIHTFSRKSRIRMLRLINQLNTLGLAEAVFLTLTTRHQSMPPAEFQRAFLAEFLPGLHKLWGNIAYLWRLEPHRDGYPHYHLIVWRTGHSVDLTKQGPLVQARRLWWKIMGDDTPAHQKRSCRIGRVEGQAGVLHYVSKYVAKEDDSIGARIRGRRWGRSHNLDTKPLFSLQLTREQTVHLRYFLHVWLKNNVDRPRNSSEYVLDHGDWWLWMNLSHMYEVLNAIGFPGAAHATFLHTHALQDQFACGLP
ncbi:hypothetical protein ES705_39313 [subsurface metagenome]